MAGENSSNNVRRCGQIGEGDDDELSMVDVLNEQARLEADANAVLGGSDANNCTYSQGYVKRQAIYACATCTPNGNAGICLACSYACHEGHDLYELYTKRFFACDCGNDKFGNNKCQLAEEKKVLNARNRYSQNFKGIYCTCSRPYPDPEDSVEDEMIQCIMCEDWYHGRHLNTSLPDDSDFFEMTCPGCMCKFSFLWAYNLVDKACRIDNSSETSDVVDVCGNTLDVKSEQQTKSPSEINGAEVTVNPSHDNNNEGEVEAVNGHDGNANLNSRVETNGLKPETTKRQQDQEDFEAPPLKKAKREPEAADSTPIASCEVKTEQRAKKEEKTEVCLLQSLQKRVVETPDCAAFWPEGWRSKLCRCEDCMALYKDRDIEFLIDEADSVQAYEAKAEETEGEEEEDETAALAGMNRVQQIEVVRGYMDLKTELNEFLQGFARDGKVVTETDIREFFQRMDQRRKDRMRIPQDNCR